jgi:hypothetical protein
MPFDKTKFMNTLMGKLPSNDVFELTMAQKTMVKTHLKSVNGRKKGRKNGGSLATANSLINHDYLPRLNANEAKQEATKGLIIIALGVVMVFGTEILVNQTFASKKPSMIAANVDKKLISQDLKSFDERLAVAPIEEGDVQ